MITQFFNRYQHDSWTPQPIPDALTTPIEKLRWIFAQDIGWIELDLDFNLSTWQEESKMADKYYVGHREEGGAHNKWRSCCIHGIEVDKTGVWNKYISRETDDVYKWTELAELTPSITAFWKQFPFEKLKRVRFMELGEHGWVAPHNDSPPGIPKEKLSLIDHIVPVNIALVHPDGCDMVLKKFGAIPWKPGKAFIVNITNDHAVLNRTDQRRVHMIGHGVIGNKIEQFANLIIRSYNKQCKM
jgi:hypothetical protein